MENFLAYLQSSTLGTYPVGTRRAYSLLYYSATAYFEGTFDAANVYSMRYKGYIVYRIVLGSLAQWHKYLTSQLSRDRVKRGFDPCRVLF